VATVDNLENIFQWERDADGFEVVFAKLELGEIYDVVILSPLLVHSGIPLFGLFDKVI